MRLFLKICASPMSDIPSLFLCRPERSEGSLGTCVPWEDRVGNVAPRRKPRGLPGDAVPNEVRDASLSLGRTKKGARQDKVGELFE